MNKEKLPVYILIRTSNRPKFFESMIESIKNQTYENIITILHIDNDDDDYYKGKCDIIVKGTPQPHEGRGYYNLYCNTLLESIPEGPGWYHFVDDDDMYADNNVIERLVENSKEDYINVGRVKRWDKTIFPEKWMNQFSYQTECFFLHTKHKDMARWWAKKAGDHYYSRQITEKLKINWIEDLLICEAQEGKGRGLKLDKGDPMPIGYIGKNISKCGARLRNQNPVLVKFFQSNKGRYIQKGKKNEVKYIPGKYVKELLSKGKIKVLSNKIKV